MRFTIHHLHPEHLRAFCECYRSCFAEPPWFEVFDPEELAAEFENMLLWDDAVLLEARDETSLIAGAVSYRADRSHGILNIIGSAYANACYFAELFVSTAIRRNGVGTALVHTRMRLAKERGYRSVIVRTSVSQPVIQRIYRSRGFRVIGLQNVKTLKRVNGKDVRIPDTRLIFHGPL